MDPERFVREHTRLTAPPLVPELRLHLSDEAYGLWARTEDAEGADRPPPFWAFAWPGGQALAPHTVDLGRRCTASPRSTTVRP